MNVPAKSSASYLLAKLIYDKCPMTEDACHEALPAMEKRTICRTLQKMSVAGQLRESDGVYSLSRHLERYFDMLQAEARGKIELVPPPYRPPIKGWSGKYNLSATARRNDAGLPREVHFLYGSTESQ